MKTGLNSGSLGEIEVQQEKHKQRNNANSYKHVDHEIHASVTSVVSEAQNSYLRNAHTSTA